MLLKRADKQAAGIIETYVSIIRYVLEYVYCVVFRDYQTAIRSNRTHTKQEILQNVVMFWFKVTLVLLCIPLCVFLYSQDSDFNFFQIATGKQIMQTRQSYLLSFQSAFLGMNLLVWLSYNHLKMWLLLKHPINVIHVIMSSVWISQRCTFDGK